MAEINFESYKASGIYFVEVYDNESYTFPLVSGRLLIGSSRIGPMNAAVSITGPQAKNRTFGNGDTYLENRGSYFHQALDTALLEGPVFGLNVIPVDLLDDDYDGNNYQNKDRGNYSFFNLEPATVTAGIPFSHIENSPAYPKDAPVKNFYNRQRFWAATPEKLTTVKNTENAGTLIENSMFSIANLSKKDVTVFMQKANTIGYDITIQEWYSLRFVNPSIPSFLHPDDMVSDYFVDIIVIEGDWTNYHQLSGDSIYGQFFNRAGLEINKINDFLQLSTIKLINRSIGSLIPDFQDAGGNVVSVDRMFNNYYPITEMIVGLDVDKMENIDLNESDFNSSVATAGTYRIDTVGHGLYDVDTNTAVDLAANGTFTIDDNTNTIIDYLSYKSPTSSYFQYNLIGYADTNDGAIDEVVYDTDDTDIVTIRAYQNSKLYKAWKLGFIKNGIKILDSEYGAGTSPTNTTYLKVSGPNETVTTQPLKYITLQAYTDASLSSLSNFKLSNPDILTNLSLYLHNTDLSEHFAIISTNATPVYEDGILTVISTNLVDEDVFNEFVQTGNYMLAKTLSGRRRVLKILSITSVTDSSDTIPITTYSIEIQPTYGGNVDGIEMDYNDDGSNTSLFVQKDITEYITAVTGVHLPAFILREQLMPNNSALRQQEIMKFVFDSGLSKAISDIETLDIRYIVDTYQGEITASSKYYWGLLGAHHGKTLVFVNDPSMKQFEENTDPSFINPSTGLISTKYITEGGNRTINPSYLYSLPNNSYNGVPIGTYMYFVGPNMIIRRNGKTLSVPPAVYASNVYVRRNKSGNKYGIPAVKRGIIGEPEVVGVEYTYDNTDRGLMETNGHNIIVRKRRVGTMIFTDNTAYYRVQSPLNSANNRDLLVTIEKAIDLILFNYLYDYNDAVVQIRIKAAIGHYLQSIVAGGGLAYADVIMDGSNNTSEIIKQNVGLIDVRIGFKYGIHKFINRISFSESQDGLKASSSGFQLL